MQEEKQQQNEQDNNKNQKDSQQQGSSSEQDGENHQQPQQQGSSDSNNATEQNKKLQEQSNGESLTDLQEEKQHDVGHDTHSLWKKSIKEQQHLDDITSKEIESKKKEAIKKLTELGEVKAFNQNKIERNQQLEELRKALASESHGYGTTTNNEIRKITDIGTSEPLIDWRKLLKEAIKYDVDWSYQNAGIEDGVVTAYLEEMPKSETEIVLDTSGSIDEILLRNFLRECKNIFQTSNVKVGCFDTQFYGFTEIKNVSDIDNLPFYGGGGTNFDVAVNAFTRRVENKIIFTDGYAKMPSIPIDAIWIVFDGRKINPVGGKVIYIDDEQLERLSNYKIIKKTKVRSR